MTRHYTLKAVARFQNDFALLPSAEDRLYDSDVDSFNDSDD